MSVHGERPSNLVRERTLADREAERVLGYHERSGSVSRATPVRPRAVGERHAQHGAAGQAAAANACVALADRDFAALRAGSAPRGERPAVTSPQAAGRPLFHKKAPARLQPADARPTRTLPDEQHER